MGPLARISRSYLRFFAHFVLRIRRPVIVGVTGSVGKTTTKEVIAAVLSHPAARELVGRVHKTPGNLNDDLGLPLTVLGFEDWHQSSRQMMWWLLITPFRALKLALIGPFADVLVLEFAVSSGSDLPGLVRLAPPKIAVVTAIGPAHLEVLGTIERIAEEKGALVRAAPKDGLVILGADNPLLAEMAREAKAPVVTVSGIGRALSDNAARAVARFFAIPEAAVEETIGRTPAVPRRLRFETAGELTIIDDTINANPLSMKLALTTLAEKSASAQRKVALLGYMAELGEQSESYHRTIGQVAHAHADVVIGVGPLAREYNPHHWFSSAPECRESLAQLVRPGDLVLVKGSASAKMDDLVPPLRALGKAMIAPTDLNAAGV